jgi:hypothetical protein
LKTVVPLNAIYFCIEEIPMKTQSLIFTIALAIGSPFALAQQQQDHEAHHPEAASQGEVQPEGATQPEQPTETPSMLSLMQQRMEEMQTHWDKMSQITDPAERQKQMQEHRRKMQALAAMMRQMPSGDPGMVGGMMGGKQGGGPGMMGGMMGGKQGGGPGMMGGKQGGGPGMMGEKQGCDPGMMRSGKRDKMHNHHMMMGMKAAYKQMSKRLDLMQAVLEQLLANQEN